MMLKITAEDLSYVHSEVGEIKQLIFGDRPWEASLLSQGARISGPSLGQYLLDHILKRTETDISAARLVRNLLTVIFAPLYHALKFSLPDLAADRLAEIISRYPAPLPQKKSAFESRVDVSMSEISSDWRVMFASSIAKVTSLEDRHLLYCCARLAIMDVCRKHLSPEVAETIERGKKLAEKVDALADSIKQPSDQQPKTIIGRNEEVLKRQLEFRKVTDTSFNDVGGCHAVKERMLNLAAILGKPEIPRRWGVKMPRGILLNGPPGTGKTLMVKALAAHTGRPLGTVRMSDVLTVWKGESVRHLRDFFEAARALRGAVLFFDEADGLIMDRKKVSVDPSDQQLVTEFNLQMEAIRSEDNLLVVLATNIKENLDEAAVRDQRIDEFILFTNPDQSERFEILNVHIAAAVREATMPPFAGPLDLTALSAMTEGLSGAALASIVQGALLKKCHAEARGATPGPVTQDDMEESIRKRLAERKIERKRIGFASAESSVLPTETPSTDELAFLLEPLD